MPVCHRFETERKDTYIVKGSFSPIPPRLGNAVTFESVKQYAPEASIKLTAYSVAGDTEGTRTIDEGETVRVPISPPKPIDKAEFEYVGVEFNGWKECVLCLETAIPLPTLKIPILESIQKKEMR